MNAIILVLCMQLDAKSPWACGEATKFDTAKECTEAVISVGPLSKLDSDPKAYRAFAACVDPTDWERK